MRSFATINTAPGYERPHVLNLAATYDIARHWRLSGKFAIASGIPGRVTVPDGYFTYSGSRSYPFLRLDMKLQKRWYINQNFFWGAYLEVLNITHTGTVSTRTCGVDGCENAGTAPITIPSLGVEASWN